MDTSGILDESSSVSFSALRLYLLEQRDTG